jgi:transposase
VLSTEFRGLRGCDYFSTYRKYLQLNENMLVQFCLAHLICNARFFAAKVFSSAPRHD